ncbi:hypothetical protein WN51_02500 [Melipona quadrifasciata]|uniref:Uncharacterized protein n=1 Tax=Melipona quadrifasciata TaxID=166423 RepID=A0A0N1IT80_9HYME|nr:hypothetical protein WN51_02500 [Melipona quadrifasciata]
MHKQAEGQICKKPNKTKNLRRAMRDKIGREKEILLVLESQNDSNNYATSDDILIGELQVIVKL